ncbi:NADH dehydrogenase (ubiquinone) B14 subunit [Lasioglossum baleicum]|uniref:NADH dehydrogenase (ubiquinone) B14 subunit n=1 Tax=Lasioglossum baleicum TaxID=434251 RepID=UPI003FCDB557
MATPARLTVKKVKPILSLNREDARRRVIALYKSYYRHIPQMLLEYDVPKTQKECQQRLREEFDRHRNVTDIRVIDLLVAKGQMKLQEISHFWITKGGLMDNFKDTIEPKPKDFMGKFLSGQDSTI